MIHGRGVGVNKITLRKKNSVNSKILNKEIIKSQRQNPKQFKTS